MPFPSMFLPAATIPPAWFSGVSLGNEKDLGALRGKPGGVFCDQGMLGMAPLVCWMLNHRHEEGSHRGRPLKAWISHSALLSPTLCPAGHVEARVRLPPHLEQPDGRQLP